MYLINSVPLHNPALGWRLLRASAPIPSLSYNMNSLERTGRDGGTWLYSTLATPTITFTIETPAASQEALFALFQSTAGNANRKLHIYKEGDTKRRLYANLVSTSMESYNPKPDRFIHSFMVQLDEPYWRSTSSDHVEVTNRALAVGNTVISLYSGISAPIQDSDIRIKGNVVNPTVTDVGSSSYVTFDGTLAANEWLRFQAVSGRAWITNTATWTGGTEVSGLIRYGGPRDVFEITPAPIVGDNILSREARLIVTQDNFSESPNLSVRGANAHIVEPA